MADSLVGSAQEQSRDNLLAFDHPHVILPITVASGEGELAHGTVLGRLTATGEYAAYTDGQSDGSETARCVLHTPDKSIDATSEAVKTYAIFHGGVRESELTGIDAAGKVDLLAVNVWVV